MEPTSFSQKEWDTLVVQEIANSLLASKCSGQQVQSLTFGREMCGVWGLVECLLIYM